MPAQTKQQILVPLDLSAASEAAVPAAVAIAMATGSGLTLLHVVAPAASLVGVGDGGVVDLPTARAGEHAWIARARGVLVELAERLARMGIAAEIEVVVDSDVAAAVAERARRDTAIRLVAMSLRSRPTFRYRVAPSIARAVAGHAGVSMLVVRSAEPPRAFTAAASFKTIMVALDGRIPAERALAEAQAIARATQAALLLVAVLPVADGVEPRDAPERLTRYLERLAAEMQDGGLAVRFQLLRGEPADAIVELARAQQVDLVIMAAHGGSDREHFRLGSVALAVARRVRQPLLLVDPH